jgi:MoaA/NifB/PqqE/SkfB family radical SAM enzyme
VTVATTLRIRASELTHRTYVVPLLLFYPTSRCNSRCVSCDWWRSTGEGDLSFEEIAAMVGTLPGLGTRVVVFSGGEPLLRPDVFAIADLFLERGIELELLTSGIFLARDASEVASRFSRVTLSLDASTKELYQEVRGIDGLTLLEFGIARLHQAAPSIPVKARATLHKANFRDLPRLVRKAREVGLDGISFLAADVTSSAFGRQGPPSTKGLILDEKEIAEFRGLVEEVIARESEAFRTGFIAESPEKLRRLPSYYAALRGMGSFPGVFCNAPWVSAVVEADGSVRPCFFHPPLGNIRRKPLDQLLHEDFPPFRRGLSIATDRVCERCVCSIRYGGPA